MTNYFALHPAFHETAMGKAQVLPWGVILTRFTMGAQSHVYDAGQCLLRVVVVIVVLVGEKFKIGS